MSPRCHHGAWKPARSGPACSMLFQKISSPSPPNLPFQWKKQPSAFGGALKMDNGTPEKSLTLLETTQMAQGGCSRFSMGIQAPIKHGRKTTTSGLSACQP